MPNSIIYEQPLTERIRLFMRYEQLMHRFKATTNNLSMQDAHSATLTLLELYALTSRIDLRADVIREIKRIIANLEKLNSVKNINQERRGSIIDKLSEEMDKLHTSSGPLGGHLKEHELFNMLRQRSSVPGGINSFDLPQYHRWLCNPAEQRQQQLLNWIMPYESLNQPINLLLTLIRESSGRKMFVAKQGFFQQMLDPRHPHLMLRIWLPENNSLYPEVSSGKHRFNIRFLELDDLATRPQQTLEDVSFAFMCCSL